MPRPLLLLFSLALVAPALGQGFGPVTVQAVAVPVEQIRIADFDPTNLAAAPVFLTLTVFNDDQQRPLELEVDVASDRYGSLGTGEADLGLLAANEVRTLTNRDLDAYMLTDAAHALIDETQAAGLLPPDAYTFTVRVLQDGVPLADDAADVETTNPALGLELLGPGHPLELGGAPDELGSAFPVFQWDSNARLFDLALYEVLPTHTSAEDVVAAQPVFVAQGLDGGLLAYPTYAEPLQGTYAWQVSARVRTAAGEEAVPSEVYWFSIDGPAADDDLSPTVRPVTRIEVLPTEATLEPEASLPLQALTYGPDDELLTAPVRWRVAPAEAGTVSEDGVFTASASPEAAVAVIAEVGEVAGHALLTIAPAPPPPGSAPSVTLVTPADASLVPTAHPDFAWQTLEVEQPAAQTYRITVWPTAGGGTGDPAGEPLWSRTATGLTLPYPSDAPPLQDQQSYTARVDLLDAQGAVLVAGTPATFAMARDPKVEWSLFQAWNQALQQGQGAESVRLMIELRSPGLAPDERAQLEAAGAIVEEVSGPWVQVQVPFDRLGDVAALDLARHLMLPSPHQTFAEALAGGPRTSGRPAPTPMAVAGSPLLASGLRVAVFEFGFSPAAIRRAAQGPEPRFYSFRQDEQIRGSTAQEALHGAATVGALLGVLPEAELHLFNFDTEAEFLEALRFAIEELGLRVITCSVSWMQAYDHYDGTSAFAQEVDDLLGDDVVLVAAAGNFGLSHWEGFFQDDDGDGIHAFANGQQTLELDLVGGVPYEFLLSWDGWDGIDADLDLTLLDASGRQTYDAYGRRYVSANRQARGLFERPVEQIRGFVSPYPGTRTYQLRIEAAHLRRGRPHLELYVYPPPVAARPAPQPASSLASGLATARSTLPVAAVGFAAGSRGPTNDDRPRPFFAADGVVGVGAARQEGTSYAAPRVAAAFALAFAARPGWDRAGAVRFLRQFVPTPGERNNRYGWGAIDIEAVVQALAPVSAR